MFWMWRLVLDVLLVVGVIDVVRMAWWWLQYSVFDDDIDSAIAQGRISLATTLTVSQGRWELEHPSPSPHLLGWPLVMLVVFAVLVVLIITFIIEQSVRWFIRSAQNAHLGPYRQVR